MKQAKPIVILLLKLLVSGGLIVYFLSRIHIENFIQTFASANYSWIALALTVYLFTQAISAVRWTMLARPLGIDTPFQDLIKYYLIGMFFNLFAPGTVGGVVLAGRAWPMTSATRSARTRRSQASVRTSARRRRSAPAPACRLDGTDALDA